MSGENCENYPDGDDPSVTHDACGQFLEQLRTEGGVGRMGLPLSDARPVSFEPVKPYRDEEMVFQRGTIYVNSETGQSGTFGWYAYEPLPGHSRSGSTES